MARGLISESDCFVLEVAELLHNIGKLGLPDSSLLKPGTLTKKEWKVMEYTTELLELCRSHQSSYLATSDQSLQSQAIDNAQCKD